MPADLWRVSRFLQVRVFELRGFGPELRNKLWTVLLRRPHQEDMSKNLWHLLETVETKLTRSWLAAVSASEFKN